VQSPPGTRAVEHCSGVKKDGCHTWNIVEGSAGFVNGEWENRRVIAFGEV
jgi:hypothetical protein